MLRYMQKSDAYRVAELYLQIDKIRFTELFENVSTLSSYIVDTFDKGGYFSSKYVLVCEENNQVVGICIMFDEIPVAPQDLGVDLSRYSAAFLDAFDSISFDVSMAQRENAVYIDAISVDKAWRCRGIATAMIQYVMKYYEHVMLYCDKENTVAYNLYVKLGFRPLFIAVVVSDDGNDISSFMAAMKWDLNA